MNVDLVLKIGGSVITEKSEPMTPNMENIRRIAKEFASAWEAKRVLLIHGGGSFGHHVALKYLDDRGRITDPKGISETRRAMHNLTTLIMDAFLEEGVPFFAFDPSACFLFEEGHGPVMVGGSLIQIELALSSGLLPALGGDVVLSHGGFGRVLSGDTIARMLALEFRAKTLAFGTDVDGYMEGGRVLRRIGKSELSEAISRAGGRAGDVTGGMAGKLSEIREYMLSGGRRSVIFNATKPGAISALMLGMGLEGTYIE